MHGPSARGSLAAVTPGALPGVVWGRRSRPGAAHYLSGVGSSASVNVKGGADPERSRPHPRAADSSSGALGSGAANHRRKSRHTRPPRGIRPPREAQPPQLHRVLLRPSVLRRVRRRTALRQPLALTRPSGSGLLARASRPSRRASPPRPPLPMRCRCRPCHPMPPCPRGHRLGPRLRRGRPGWWCACTCAGSAAARSQPAGAAPRAVAPA
eukprot:scaffold45055_cov270-Isochrysis_galbana.AAC.2